MTRSLALILAGLFVFTASVADAQTYVASTPIRYTHTYQVPSQATYQVPSQQYVRQSYVQPTYTQTYNQPAYQVSRPVYQAPVTNYRPTTGYTNSYAGTGSNVFTMLNSQRTRQGAPALQYDPTLQAVAEQRARQMASMGLKNHPPGSFAPGRYEGVGWSSSYSPSAVSACFINDRRMSYAGAAMARGSDGVYFAVVYR